MKKVHKNMVISYPKCGRTWLRVAMGFLLCEKWGIPKKDMLSNKINNRSRYPYFYHDKSKGRIVQGTDKKRFAKSKVILLVRNPFDVMVSYYHDMHAPYMGSISDFIKNDHYGIKNLLKLYNTWHKNRTDAKKFMVLKYEDMHHDMGSVLKKVFDFFDFEQPSEEDLSRAIKFSSFDNMKKLENKGYFNNSISMSVDKKKGKRRTRKGKVNGYRDYLSEKDIEHINRRMHYRGCVFYRTDDDKVYDFDQRMKNIVDAKKILNKLKIRFWIESGTLLGFYRDNDFIKWDNDVDIIVFSEEAFSRLDEIESEFNKFGFTVEVKKQDEEGKRFKISTVRGDDILMICSYFLNKETMTRVRVPYRFPDRLFGDNKKIKIRNVELPCPDPIEEYLEITYGPWRETIMAEEGYRYRRGELTNVKLEYLPLEKIYNKDDIYKYKDTIIYHGYEHQNGD